MLIFGYGSLIAIPGINGRWLRRNYKECDLEVAYLTGLKRSWNTVWNKMKFLGLVESPNTRLNGVLFELNDKDVDSFLDSECSGRNEVNPVYRLIEVTDKVFPKQNDKVFTCLTIRPQNDEQVPSYYIDIINDCLDIRGPKFEREFWQSTENGNDEKVNEFYRTRLMKLL